MRSIIDHRLLRFLLSVITTGQLVFASNSGVTAAAGAEFKYEEPKYLTGSIYAHDGKQLLYTFKRVASRSGSLLTVERNFLYPDGKLAATEQVVYNRDALMSYELNQMQIGARGSARIQRSPNDPAKGTIEFTYGRAADSRPKQNTEVLRANTLIADMVATFLVSNWNALMRGEKLRSRYIVVPRRETVGFTFVKDSTAVRAGQPVVIVRMEPTSRFVAALVDPLYFTFDQRPPHHVIQYTGRTTPKINANGQWKDLDAVTVFDWNSAH